MTSDRLTGAIQHQDWFLRIAFAPMAIVAAAFAVSWIAHLAGLAPKFAADLAAVTLPITGTFMLAMFMFETRIRRAINE